jgi:hypothetical protein
MPPSTQRSEGSSSLCPLTMMLSLVGVPSTGYKNIIDKKDNFRDRETQEFYKHSRKTLH